MKKWIYGLFVLMALLMCVGALAQEEFVNEFPAALRFTQVTQSTDLSKNVHVKCVYPDTASDEVDAQMRTLIDEMTARNAHYLPEKWSDVPVFLEVGAQISRSGESALSFLTLAEYRYDRDMLSVDFETRVYDALNGKRITLPDLFEENSGAYEYIADEVRRQLSEAFIGIEPDEAALSALCELESIREASFILGAAQMTLTPARSAPASASASAVPPSVPPSGSPRLMLITSAPRRSASSTAAIRCSSHARRSLSPNTFMQSSCAAGAAPEKPLVS